MSDKFYKAPIYVDTEQIFSPNTANEYNIPQLIQNNKSGILSVQEAITGILAPNELDIVKQSKIAEALQVNGWTFGHAYDISAGETADDTILQLGNTYQIYASSGYPGTQASSEASTGTFGLPDASLGEDRNMLLLQFSGTAPGGLAGTFKLFRLNGGRVNTTVAVASGSDNFTPFSWWYRELPFTVVQ